AQSYAAVSEDRVYLEECISTRIQAGNNFNNQLMLTENDDRKFKCERCGKCYRHSASLSKHVNYECGKEPQFKCKICPFSTKQKGTLKTHIYLKHSRINFGNQN
ncbi:hypothetical protein LSTR_LSTR000999, partial [Laodelphax striatellus]